MLLTDWLTGMVYRKRLTTLRNDFNRARMLLDHMEERASAQVAKRRELLTKFEQVHAKLSVDDRESVARQLADAEIIIAATEAKRVSLRADIDEHYAQIEPFYRGLSGWRDRSRGSDSRFSHPPGLPCFLLELLITPELSECVVGDLFEQHERKYRRVSSKFGAFAARVDFWWQVIRSVPRLLDLRLRNVAVFAVLLEIIQKYWSTR